MLSVQRRRSMEIDAEDIRGNLETIANLALIGIFLVDLNRLRFIPTVLGLIDQEAQRLVLEYAVRSDSICDSKG